MLEWRRAIQCYVSPAGRNKIADWHLGLSVQERADADTFISNIRKLRKWQMPDYKVLSGMGGIGELRWESEDKEHRLIGFFSGEIWYALIGCNHKQKRYTPTECLETAKTRKKDIEFQRVETVEYDL